MSDAISDAKKGLVPKLRFPEFRESREWEAKSICQSCESYSGGTPTSSNKAYYGGSIPFIRSAEIGDDTTELFLTEEGLADSSAKMVRAGDILYALYGANSGEVAIAKHDGAINQAILCLRAKSSNKFIFPYLYHNKDLIVAKFVQGGQGNLSGDIVKAINVPFPPLPEQQTIADCLSSLDKLIAAHSDKLDTLKTHKKGLLQQLFPRDGETVPRLRFPEFRNEGKWEEKSLSHLIDSLDAGVSVNSGDRSANNDETGILKTSSVTEGLFDPAENKVVADEAEVARLKEPVLGDTVIISRMNTPLLVGANAYVAKNAGNLFLPDRLWAAKPKSDASMRFIAYLLGSSYGRLALSSLATGTSGSMKNIAKMDVLDLGFQFPKPSEQQKIAYCLSALDDRITAQADKIEALKEHKKGLLQQLFPAMDDAG